MDKGKMNNIKKFLFGLAGSILLVLASLSPLFTKNVKAQGTWYNQNPEDFYLKVYDPSTPASEIFGERYTAAQVQWVFYSVMSQPLLWLGRSLKSDNFGPCVVLSITKGAFSVDHCTKAFVEILKYAVLGDANTIPSIANNTPFWRRVFFENRSLSGISYVRYTLSNLRIISVAQAQNSSANSFGFTALLPIRDLWYLTRDISYFFFVVATLIFAFMIMFRVKIAPQVVITVQSTLPKIIITLILVTFSFAIAGFLVDFLYIIMGLFSAFVSVSMRTREEMGLFNFINGNFNIPAVRDSGLYLFVYFEAYLFGYLIAILVIFVDAIASLSVTSTVWTLLFLLFFIVLIFMLIFNFFRVILMLFKNLAMVYITVMLAPIQIAMGLFPSNSRSGGFGMGFGGWVKSLLAKLLVFPVAGIMVYFAFYFLVFSIKSAVFGIVSESFVVNALDKIVNSFTTLLGVPNFQPSIPDLWGPPLLGNAATATAIAFLLISIFCILGIPKLAEALDKIFKGMGYDYGSAIAEDIKKGGYITSSVAEYAGDKVPVGDEVVKRLGELGKVVFK